MATPPISVGLPSFSGTGSLSRFKDDFETFSALQGWEKEKQASLLPLCLSGIARDAYDSLGPKQKKDVSAAFEQLKAAFPADGVVEAQVQLRSLRFQPGGNLDAFVVQLRLLVSRAFPSTDSGGLLYNYFLQSLPASYQQELVSDGIQNFDAAVKKVRNMSCAAKLSEEATRSVRQVTVSEADALRQKVQELESKLSRLERSRIEPSGRRGQTTGRVRTCFCCGFPGHTRASCRKRHLACHTCGTVGHLAKVCNQSGNSQRAGMGPNPRPERQTPETQGVQRGPDPNQWDVRPQVFRPRQSFQPPQQSPLPPATESAKGRSA